MVTFVVDVSRSNAWSKSIPGRLVMFFSRHPENFKGEPPGHISIENPIESKSIEFGE